MDEQPPPKRVKLRNDGFPGVSSDSGECCNFFYHFRGDRRVLTYNFQSAIKFNVEKFKKTSIMNESGRINRDDDIDLEKKKMEKKIFIKHVKLKNIRKNKDI